MVDDCQLLVFNPKRFEKAEIFKEAQCYQNKNALALAMLKVAIQRGIRFCYVGIDGGYAKEPAFLRDLDRLVRRFVVDIHYDQAIYLQYPDWLRQSFLQHEIITGKQLDELYPEMTQNANLQARKNAWWFTLEKSNRREEVAEMARIDEDTVTHYTKKYDKSGLSGLLKENYHQPKSQLARRIQTS